MLWGIAIASMPAARHRSIVDQRSSGLEACLAATPDYLARHGIPKTPADLANHRCIRFGPDRNQDFWSVVDPDGMTDRVPIGGQIICEDRVASSAAVRAGLGIAAIPQSILRQAEADGTLSEVLPGSRAEAVTLYALIPSGRHRVPRIRVVVDWLATFMQDLFEDNPSSGE